MKRAKRLGWESEQKAREVAGANVTAASGVRQLADGSWAVSWRNGEMTGRFGRIDQDVARHDVTTSRYHQVELLGARCATRLRARGMRTLQDVSRFGMSELLTIPGIGRRSIDVIHKALRERGLRLYDGPHRRPPWAKPAGGSSSVGGNT